MNYDDWPNCAISGCPNKCCLRLNSKYCWPHTPGIRPDEVRESIKAQDEREASDLADILAAAGAR